MLFCNYFRHEVNFLSYARLPMRLETGGVRREWGRGDEGGRQDGRLRLDETDFFMQVMTQYLQKTKSCYLHILCNSSIRITWGHVWAVFYYIKNLRFLSMLLSPFSCHTDLGEKFCHEHVDELYRRRLGHWNIFCLLIFVFQYITATNTSFTKPTVNNISTYSTPL